MRERFDGALDSRGVPDSSHFRIMCSCLEGGVIWRSCARCIPVGDGTMLNANLRTVVTLSDAGGL